jgi:small subunit ribosomal protein S17
VAEENENVEETEAQEPVGASAEEAAAETKPKRSRKKAEAPAEEPAVEVEAEAQPEPEAAPEPEEAPVEVAAEAEAAPEPAQEPVADAEEEPVPEEGPYVPVEAAAEAEASAEPGVGAEEAYAPITEPETAGTKKRKRVPRSQRRQRAKPAREKPKTRKPLTRLEKPAGERGRTQERRGVVVSSAMEKTIVVRVDTLKVHPKYKKVIRRSSKLHAHDEQNEAKAGDVVRIVESRPLSKTKRWRLAEILEVAK